MDSHIQTLLNRLSFISITLATLTLILHLSQIPHSCNSPPKPQIQLPTSSCTASRRQFLSIRSKNKRIWSTNDWKSKVRSFTHFFNAISDLGLLSNNSKALCVSAGAGHEVMALLDVGLADVTGVELVESPPLVSRADPLNLPFFDGVFDFVFTAHFAEALFPPRFVAEMERVVRVGGVCVVVVVEECGEEGLEGVKGLFGRSGFVDVRNVSLIGLKMTRIIMRNGRSQIA